MTNSTLNAENIQRYQAPNKDIFLLQAALNYARRNWLVLPVWWPEDGDCACGNPKCQPPAKHPIGELAPNGRNSATTDIATIKLWWRRYPKANIGIATGAKSGLVLVDIDPPKGGEESWREIKAKVGTLALTTKNGSGGGGWHYYLQYPGGEFSLKSLSGIGGFPGLDVKADCRYIVAPPSRHIGGDEYSWQIHPDSTSPATCPQWLLKLINAENARPTKEALQTGEPILMGSRNDSLTHIAGAMRRQGAIQEEIESALLVVNQKRCQPPLSPPEVGRIAQSVSRYESVTSFHDRTHINIDLPLTTIQLNPLAGVAYQGLAGILCFSLNPIRKPTL